MFSRGLFQVLEQIWVTLLCCRRFGQNGSVPAQIPVTQGDREGRQRSRLPPFTEVPLPQEPGPQSLRECLAQRGRCSAAAPSM